MEDRVAPIPFPPRPRAWTQLTDRIIAAAARSTNAVDWQPVHIEGLSQSWVGVRAPSLDTERAWQWDVATPDDCARERLLRTDPLTLAVAQDVMVIDLRRHDDPCTCVRMQVQVGRVPESIDVCASALPPYPWYLDLATGWSAMAIALAIREWSKTNVGHELEVHPNGHHAQRHRDSDDSFALGDDLWATSGGFDALLALDPRDAAMATTAFRGVIDALDHDR